MTSSVFNKEQQRLMKRREIVRVAGRLFCKQGFQATSLNDIAGEMGMTKTVIYYYFRNKEEIFILCHRQAIDAMEAAMNAARNDDPIIQIRDFIRIYVCELIGVNNPGAVLLDDYLLPREEGDEIRARKNKVQQALEDLIVEGKARGLIGECDTKAAIMALMSAINILPRWFNEKGKLSPETLAESYSHVFTYGLAAR